MRGCVVVQYSIIIIAIVMRRSLFSQKWPAVLVLAFIVILAAALALRTLARDIPTTFLTVAHNDDVISGHPAPPSTAYGAHNFRRPNHVITEYDEDVAARLATLVERRSTAADPDLIRLIVDMLDAPSTHMVKMSRQLLTTPQSREVDKILKQKVTARLSYQVSK